MGVFIFTTQTYGFENENWLNAETRCRIYGAHLASIHSYEESLFVADLAYFKAEIVCNGHNDVWVGFFTDDNNTSWRWTDGTPFDYQRWSIGQPDLPKLESCGTLFLSPARGGKFGLFNNFECQKIVAKYVCKKYPA